MEKLKVYLDTNMIIDFFINQTKALREGTPPIVPEKLKFFLANADKINFVTSIATEAEIARELIGGLNVDSEKFENLWEKFLQELNCFNINEFVLDKKFSELPKKYRIKLRTLINFIHLFLAIRESAYIVTGDKDLITVTRQNKLYDKILSYIELRKLIAFSFSSQDL